MNFIDGFQHVIRTWIHSLSAFDNIVYAQFFEKIIDSFTDRNCNESHWFSRLTGFLLCRILRLLFRKILCITDQFLLMFFTHIVNLHAG